MKSLFLPLSFAFLAAACGGSDNTTPAANTDAGADTATSASNVIKFTMNVKVAKSTEVHRCQLIKMPKSADGEIFIGARSHEYTSGSHHFLIFRTDLTEIPAGMEQQVGCYEGAGMMKHQRGYVAGGQKPKESDKFPEGVALAFKSEEVLLFQSHYLNAGSSDLDATVNVEWTTVPKDSVKHRAGVTNFYHPFIYVPAKGEATAQMSCPFTQDVTILGAGAHMHKRGVFYEAFLDEAGKPPATTPFYTTDDWEHPINFIGPAQWKSGTRVRFKCHYKNPDERTYIQGQSAEDNEMCMFSAVYYPEMKLEDGQCRNGMAQIGQGTKTCSEVSSCAQACPPSETSGGPADVSECAQKCVVDGCPSSTEKFTQQIMCLQANCAADCKASQDSCRMCMQAKCLSQALLCLNHTCG
jgi:hypothetical protein